MNYQGTIYSQHDKRMNEVLIGIFFVMASASAIAGLKLYDPALIGDNHFSYISESRNQIRLGAFFELLLVCSNIGTGIMLFPYLRAFNERLGIGYLVFRFLESVLITIGIISVLALLSLASSYTSGHHSQSAGFFSEAALLKAVHDWTFILGPHFVLGINTSIYSFVFLKTGLVPRKLALMGLVGSVSIFIAANLELFDVIQMNSLALILLAMPIAFYEMILAAWLFAKGFKRNSVEIWS